MTKEIDDGKDRNPKTGFKRGMTTPTLLRRFNLQMQSDGSWTVNGNPIDYETHLPACPECGHICVISKFTISAGVDVFWPQCTQNTDKDHGFGKFSRYGTRSLQGRKPGSKNEEKEKIKVEINETEIKREPIKQVEIKISGKLVHPEIQRAARYVLSGERNIYLTGPAGTGKSTGAEDIFKVMQTQDNWKASQIHMLTVSMSTFVSDLAGFLDRLNGGSYLESDLVKAMKTPGLVVVDEADKGNPNLAGFWNTILANNKITTPGGVFERHVDNVICFIGNTTGHAPSKQYSGSVRQDFATLDRFRCFNIGFSEEVELAAISNLDNKLYGIVKRIRKNAETSGLQRIIGLRWARRCNQAMSIEGKGAKDTILQVMRDESWSEDEILSSGIHDMEKTEEPKKAANPNKIKYYEE